MISDSCSPPTFTAPNTTTLPYRLHPPVLYLQSSRRSWTVCATTKKQPQSGLTVRLQNVHVWPYDNMRAILIHLINTWSLMETAYTSPMHLLHPLLRAHFRTKSSHLPSFGLAVMDYQELTPFITKDISRCTLATVHPLPLHGPPQPHHTQGHRTLQTALP